MNYRIFDILVSSNRKLLDLPQSPPGVADILIEFHSGQFRDSSGFQPVHVWLDDEAQFSMACSRRGDEYLFEFPGEIHFQISTITSSIQVHPGSRSQEPVAKRLLLDQVIPRLVFHKGRAVLHASAVVLPSGVAVAFMGKTGHGKSTLAAAFLQAGCQILTDDCLLLEVRNKSLTAVPAYPGLRLWPDSVAELGLDPAAGTTGGRTDGKLFWSAYTSECQNNAATISALFVLGDPKEAAMAGVVESESLTGAGAMMALVESAFVLDLVSKDAVRCNFRIMGAIADFGVPIYRLNYPRRHSDLPAVRKLVECVQQGEPFAPSGRAIGR